LKACPCEVGKQNRAAPFFASIEDGLAVITGNGRLHQSFNLFRSENIPRFFVAFSVFTLAGNKNATLVCSATRCGALLAAQNVS
jgi:hypothetical protein